MLVLIKLHVNDSFTVHMWSRDDDDILITGQSANYTTIQEVEEALINNAYSIVTVKKNPSDASYRVITQDMGSGDPFVLSKIRKNDYPCPPCTWGMAVQKLCEFFSCS